MFLIVIFKVEKNICVCYLAMFVYINLRPIGRGQI